MSEQVNDQVTVVTKVRGTTFQVMTDGECEASGEVDRCEMMVHIEVV